MALVFVFPGQGSQSLGMQQDLAAAFEAVQGTYDQASEVLGYDLWQLVQDGPAERLNETVVTQPAMLTAGVAAWRAWQAAGGEDPQQLAGHSLGEYSALVCAGALEFDAALRLVQRRAQLMQDAVPAGAGAMAAILGLDDQQVLQVCEQTDTDGVAEAVNFNAPGQVVIAGDRAAVERVIEAAREQGARRAIMLPVSVPAHSSLMRSAGEALAGALADTAFLPPAITVVNGVDATPYRDAADIREKLRRQIFSPVRWVDAMRCMLANDATAVIECGPGKVLAGLSRRIERGVPSGYVDTPESMQAALQLQQ
ncbi:MAG: ACP S-malonyltransferase [Gammaproteobacteria bacterium]|nr:MAG: ACP S-malonyltransferase [Gammaproteobacteria bacterium]